MFKIIFFLISLFLLEGLNAQESKSANSTPSGSGKFGLGLTLLGPTGITGKYLMNDKLSIEGSLGMGLLGYGRFHLHGVLLYNFYQINDSLSLYAGGGAVLLERGGRRDRDGRGRRHFFGIGMTTTKTLSVFEHHWVSRGKTPIKILNYPQKFM